MSLKNKKIPYPPSPNNVPEGFTDYADSFTRKQNLLLAGLFVFLIFYIAMVIFFAMVGTWCVLTFSNLWLVKIVGIAVCGISFLYLVKGFFKRHPMNKVMHLEITEKEHPILFGFIEQLCDELGAPLPNKVFVSPDVNAACMSRSSLLNLFVQPKRDLLIGLGLVNCMNLSEFKAVLAHEFGHFCHLGPTNNYAFVVYTIIIDLVAGEDWLDRMITWSIKQKNGFSIFGHALGGCLWVPRKVLLWILNIITFHDRALSREQEFHADKVAVSAAGSDASTHGLLRARFGMQCFIQAINDLVAPGRDHKIYTNDLYLHQDRAAAIVRRRKKEPEMGLPPILPTPTSGKTTKVFDAEQDELEDQDDTPPMWRTHPSDADREENAKAEFIPAVMDHRSPWILFSKVAELKERMTYKFYRMEFRIVKDSDLTDAVKVQEYIDNEHAETTYDPKYHGAYDDRPLEPGDLFELNTIVRDSPWADERMLKVYDKLYDGCQEHAEAHADLHKELQSLRSNVVGKPTPKMKRMIAEVEKKLDSNWEWFKSFDRRVYLLHIQMAESVDEELRQEFVERYRFQLEVQRFYQDARKNFNEADSHLNVYFAASRGEIQVSRDFGAQVIAVLRAAWKALKKIVQDAREINLPAMKNFEEGERLADFILEGKMVPEPPLSELKGVWVQKLMNQLHGVKNRCFRLHFKSVGGVLAIQEKIASRWLEVRRPVAAEVIAAEVIPADIVAAEVVDDIIAAEVIPADVVEEPSPLEELRAEVIPDSPVSESAINPSVAAFVSTPPHPLQAAKPGSLTHAKKPAVASPPPFVPPLPAEPVEEIIEPVPLVPPEPVAEQIEPLPLDEIQPSNVIAEHVHQAAEPVQIPSPDNKPAIDSTAPTRITTDAVELPPPTIAPPAMVETEKSVAIDLTHTVPATSADVSTASMEPEAEVISPPVLTPTIAAETVKAVSFETTQSLPEAPADVTTALAGPTVEPETSSVPSLAPDELLEADRPAAFEAAQATPETKADSFSNFNTDTGSPLPGIVGETLANAPVEQVPNSTFTEEIGYNSSEVASATTTEISSQNVDPDLAVVPDLPAPVSETLPQAEEKNSFDAMKTNAVNNSKTSAKKPPVGEPIPIEEVFSLDSDEAPAPMKPPVEEPIPIEEVFSLDADEAQAAAAIAKPLSLEEPIPVEEIFSLDADESAPAATANSLPVEELIPAVEELIPVEEVFPLDEDEKSPLPIEEVLPLDEEVIAAEEVIPVEEVIPAEEVIEAETPAQPAAIGVPKPAFGGGAPPVAKSTASPVAQPQAEPSGSVATPTSRPAFGSAKPTDEATDESENAAPTQLKGKRPAVKITLVRPGDKSPFGK